MSLTNHQFGQLLGAVNLAFRQQGIAFQVGHQDNDDAHNLSFKRPTLTGRRGAVLCHLLYEDGLDANNDADLIFRFRAGRRPQDWFAQRRVTRLARTWCRRFVRQYTAERVPARAREHAAATDQFGIALTENDLHSPHLVETIGIFLNIASESVREGARNERNRNWGPFNELTN